MKSVKKKSAKSKPHEALPRKRALLKDLRNISEYELYEAQKWVLSVVKDAIRYVSAK